MRPILPSWMRLEEGLTAVGVFLGHGHDEAKVGFGHVASWPAGPRSAARFRSAKDLWNSSRPMRTNSSRVRSWRAPPRFGGAGGGLVQGFEFLDAPKVTGISRGRCCHNDHFLDDLLFVVELGESGLELLSARRNSLDAFSRRPPVAALRQATNLVSTCWSVARTFLMSRPEVLEVAVAIRHLLVDDDAVEPFLRWVRRGASRPMAICSLAASQGCRRCASSRDPPPRSSGKSRLPVPRWRRGTLPPI